MTGSERRPVLLTTDQVAEFVARGLLVFEGLIDGDTCGRAHEEMASAGRSFAERGGRGRHDSGEPLSRLYPPPSALGEIIRHPVVSGAIHSLAGADASFDHDFVHLRVAGDRSFQSLHADAIVDPTIGFDVQLFFFPTEVAPHEGGTGFVPGTHLRVVNESSIGRYRHMRGERQWAGAAGSVLLFHEGLWHRALPNSGADRLMYKLRLNPGASQVRQWDTAGLDTLLDHRDHVFATASSSIAETLRSREPWMGTVDHRLAVVNRLHLWRYLTGDETVDVDWYLTRIAGHQVGP